VAAQGLNPAAPAQSKLIQDRPRTEVPMKLIAPALAAAGIAVLAGCASHPADTQTQPPPLLQAPAPIPGPGSAASSGEVGMGTPSTGGDAAMAGSMMRTPTARMSTEDALALCDLNRQIKDAKTPEERQALVQRVLPGMTPQEREHHLRMMQERCH
jgi:hypothetical protein